MLQIAHRPIQIHLKGLLIVNSKTLFEVTIEPISLNLLQFGIPNAFIFNTFLFFLIAPKIDIQLNYNILHHIRAV